mmetsp:Transcript_27314/g.70883  ORF Transcript_27314/g.70883 Transcript_27314/m.70883 type:complete len:798 (+) Transcript_27314:252-2645(+)
MGTCASVPDEGGGVGIDEAAVAMNGHLGAKPSDGKPVYASSPMAGRKWKHVFGCGVSEKYNPADEVVEAKVEPQEQPALKFAKTVTKELKSKGAHHKRATSTDVEVYVRSLFENARSRSSTKKIEAHTNMAARTATLPSPKAVQHLDHGVISTTALQDAAFAGQVDSVARLVRNGSYDVNERYDNLDTPLHVAAAAGHALMARELLHHGADLLAVDRDGWTAMHQAALQGHVEVVRTLLEWVELKDGLYLRDQMDAVDSEGMTPLHAAVHMRNYTATRNEVERLSAVVDLLTSRGANVNFADYNGWTPLHVAVQCGHVSLVEALMAAGADVLHEDNSGKLPVDYACNSKGTQFRSREISRILAEAAASRTPAERPSTPRGSRPTTPRSSRPTTPRNSQPTTPQVLSPRSPAAPDSPLLWDTSGIVLSPRHVAIAAAIVPTGTDPDAQPASSSVSKFTTPRATPKPTEPPSAPVKPYKAGRSSSKPAAKKAALPAAARRTPLKKTPPAPARKAATSAVPKKATGGRRRTTKEDKEYVVLADEAPAGVKTGAETEEATATTSAPSSVSTSVQVSPDTSPALEPVDSPVDTSSMQLTPNPESTSTPEPARPNDDLILPYTGNSPSPSPRLMRKARGQPVPRETVRKSAVLRRKQLQQQQQTPQPETEQAAVPTPEQNTDRPVRKLKRTQSEEKLGSWSASSTDGPPASPPPRPMPKSESATALSTMALPTSAKEGARQQEVRYTAKGVPYVYELNAPEEALKRNMEVATKCDAPAMFNYHNPTFRKTDDELPTPSMTPRE